MKRIMVAAIVGLLAGGLVIAASAKTPSAQDEINTAHAHALMAESANTVDMAHTHLQHVINCLVGPQGSAFDASAGNPCKGQGNGALPDSASNPELHAKLQQALATAQAALQTNEIATVHAHAGKVAKTLMVDSAPKASSW